MVFSSLLFLFGFLPLFLFCYYLAPDRLKNGVALFGSYFFYAWGEPIFAIILFGSSAIDYVLSRMLGKLDESDTFRRNLILLLSILLNLGFLAYFKYANFFVAQINNVLGMVGRSALPWQEVVLPIGISFFTFQKLSYMIDLYRGIVKPARSFLSYALYVVLFPQLIAGPIVRYHDVAQQLSRRTHSAEKFTEGIWRFSLGLAKKTLIANVMGGVADWAFNPQLENLPLWFAWAGLFAYSFQIYFDFSGYSDMAIGLGRMMGFEFLENFNRPYTAVNFTDFWRRWHISLSNWFREYLYIPLGGNKCSASRSYINLWIVFLFSGLWHGASWTFIAWGAFHGFFLTLNRIFHGRQGTSRLPLFFARARTFVLVSLGWVFFRCETFGHAFDYFKHLGDFSTIRVISLPLEWGSVFENQTVFVFLLSFLIVFFPDRIHLNRAAGSPIFFDRLRIGLKQALAFLLLSLSVSSLTSMDFNPFIYFRF